MKTNPACKTTPRPGERVYSFVTRTAHELLLRAGASEPEAEDFAEIVYARCGYDVLTMAVHDARTLLGDWREDRRQVAASIREDRRQHLAAGYLGTAVDAPVYLNGKTPW